MTEDEHRIAARPRESGLLIVHTGNGKGKTTAAMGLALRAVGQGFRVLMIQFVKGSRHYGELEAAKHLHPRFEILPLGLGMMRPFGREPGAKDREAAREAWEKARSAIVSREYGMVILDEIHIALHRGLLPIWCAYPALEGFFRETSHRRVFVGVVEGDAPRQKTLDAIRKAGIRRVMLVPFMLVAGTHFLEDLAGEEDSWRQALESAGLEVILHEKGLGLNPAVVECFAAHIREALDVIPTQVQIGGVQPPVRHPVSAGERRP